MTPCEEKIENMGSEEATASWEGEKGETELAVGLAEEQVEVDFTSEKSSVH